MRRRLLVLPAALVATLALLAGCSSGDEPSGEETPLATPQGEGEFVPPPSQPTDPLAIETYRVCVDLSSQPDELLVREELLSPSEDVTLTSVEAIGAQGVTLVDSWVTPAEGGDQGGVIEAFPPTVVAQDAGYRWEDREAAEGAALEGGSSYHLFVHLSREQQASIDGVRVGYTSGGEEYETGTTNKYVFGGGC